MALIVRRIDRNKSVKFINAIKFSDRRNIRQMQICIVVVALLYGAATHLTGGLFCAVFFSVSVTHSQIHNCDRLSVTAFSSHTMPT